MTINNETKVGIAIFAAVLVFFGGLLYLKGAQLPGSQYTLTLFYSDVMGLQEGTQITVEGLKIGQVESMTMHGNRIAVEASIKRGIRLPRDSKAVLKSESIMGGKYIAIASGNAHEYLNDGDTLSGVTQGGLAELTESLTPISTNILGMLHNINATFDQPTRERIQRIISTIDSSATDLQGLVRGESRKVGDAITNFTTLSRDLSRLVSNVDSFAQTQRANVDSGLTDFRHVAMTLNSVSADLKETSQSLNEVLGRVQGGEGTVGRLINDNSLYEHLDSLSMNLNDLVRDLRDNPTRYVRLSIF